MRSTYALRITTMMTACLLLAMALPAYGQGRARGRSYSKGDVERIIRRAEDKSDDFRKLIDRELDRSIIDKTKLEDNIWEQVKDLEKALDRLRSRFDRTDSWRETRNEVSDVLAEARDLNSLMRRVSRYSRVRPAWESLRYDLNTLAGIYNLPRLG